MASTRDSSASPRKGMGKRRLAALRAALEAERERLLAQVARLDAEFRDESWKEPRSDDEAEKGSATYEREQTHSLAQHARTQIARIDDALQRMDAGRYGICDRCGQPIDPDRLEARPHVVLCVTCQQAEERGR